MNIENLSTFSITFPLIFCTTCPFTLFFNFSPFSLQPGPSTMMVWQVPNQRATVRQPSLRLDLVISKPLDSAQPRKKTRNSTILNWLYSGYITTPATMFVYIQFRIQHSLMKFTLGLHIYFQIQFTEKIYLDKL